MKNIIFETWRGSFTTWEDLNLCRTLQGWGVSLDLLMKMAHLPKPWDWASNTVNRSLYLVCNIIDKWRKKKLLKASWEWNILPSICKSSVFQQDMTQTTQLTKQDFLNVCLWVLILILLYINGNVKTAVWINQFSNLTQRQQRKPKYLLTAAEIYRAMIAAKGCIPVHVVLLCYIQ